MREDSCTCRCDARLAGHYLMTGGIKDLEDAVSQHNRSDSLYHDYVLSPECESIETC